MKKTYGSGDITRKQRQAELSLLCMTLHTDLFCNPTKYHSNISNGFGVMLRKQYERKNMDQGTYLDNEDKQSCHSCI